MGNKADIDDWSVDEYCYYLCMPACHESPVDQLVISWTCELSPKPGIWYTTSTWQEDQCNVHCHSYSPSKMMGPGSERTKEPATPSLLLGRYLDIQDRERANNNVNAEQIGERDAIGGVVKH